MRPIGVITWNTFRENLRDKILYNLLVFSFFLIGASVLLGELTFAEPKKVVTDFGLAAINIIGVIVAIFVGIGLVNKEIERRTLYTIMARPISRSQFILGKYCGLLFTVSVNVLIMLSVYLFTLWIDQAAIHIGLFQAVGLILVEVYLVTAMALFFSTFSSATLSATLTAAFYFIGHLTTDLRGVAEKSENFIMKSVISTFYYLFPNLELLNIKGQAARGLTTPLMYQFTATLYGILYAGMLVVAACLVFRHRDF